jgi:hypothetical protein
MVMVNPAIFSSMNAMHSLLRESIDYAGLFPPAGLDMRTAVENYARYAAGRSAWALGRFIVSVNQLEELEVELGRIPFAGERPWRGAALLGADLQTDVELLDGFNRRYQNAGILIDTMEVKATSERRVGEISAAVPTRRQTYIELPHAGDPRSLLQAVRDSGRRAKVRTGGVTPESFPDSRDLLRFLRAAVEHSVPFKATAGLHHPLRATYRLTYAENSPRGTMFGFLNLMLAVAFLRMGMHETEVMQVLEEGDPDSIQADSGGIAWRGRHLDHTALSDARRLGMTSFGSCSFTEPIEDLETMALLAPGVPQA